MHIQVRFFASIRERLRREQAECELPAGATVADLWAHLRETFPALADAGRAVRFAVNQEYVDPSHRLGDNDEVALIPPVSGGAPCFAS